MTLPAKPKLYISSFYMRCLYSLSFAFSFLCHSSFFLSFYRWCCPRLALNGRLVRHSRQPVCAFVKSKRAAVCLTGLTSCQSRLGVPRKRTERREVFGRYPKQVSFKYVQWIDVVASMVTKTNRSEHWTPHTGWCLRGGECLVCVSVIGVKWGTVMLRLTDEVGNQDINLLSTVKAQFQSI